MNFKKKVNGSWTDTPHYIHKTATDTITTLPADIYANDTTATVGLKGNMSQSSTPTPDNPIQPQETGEMTGNLFDKSQPSTVGFVREDGTINENNNYRISDYIQLLPNTQYTVSNMNVNGLYPAVCFYTDNKTYISGIKYDGATVFTFTTPSNCKYVLVSYLLSLVNNVMLNLGSTPLPYEPYGYKIPISSANTTTPVYLGEVETTRQVKKLVLTGEETIRLQSINEYNIANFYINIVSVAKDGLSSHFEKQNTTIGQTQTEGFLLAVSWGSTTLYMRTSTSRASTTTEMQTWLSNQYTNGTPVTFWYTTEDTTTGIVNEPLMKIGEYADEVSGISIPVTAGGDTISVDTTVQPSEVTVNYKGWHPVADVHERENGAWT